VFENDVTVVVNCYYIVSSNPVDCKCDILKDTAKGNSLEYKYGNYMFEVNSGCKLMKYTLLNSSLPYIQQYYSNVKLSV